MANRILLGSIALEPNRWTADKVPHNALVDLLPEIARFGFQNVEVWQYHIDRLSSAELEQIVTVAAEYDIRFPSIALYPDLGRPQQENEEVFADLVERCTVLGVGRIKTFSGNRAKDSLSAHEAAVALDQLRLLIDIAAEKEIIVSAELHQNSLTDSVEAAEDTLRNIDRPLSICFQPMDFTDSQSALDDFRSLHESIDHVHLQGRRSGEFSLLEDADINYPEFFNMAIDLKYSGDYCIEFVRGCIVDSPDEFPLDEVLETARTDYDFVQRCLSPTNP